jgi:V8-like Glu-specific endopeptidase
MSRSRLMTILLQLIVLATVLISCRVPNSALRIDSGKFIDGKSKNTVPAVMWIGMCTATAVSHNTLITAAHCVVQNGQQSPNVCIKSGTIAKDKCSIALYTPDEYKKGDRVSQYGPHMATDVAVAVFEDNTFSQHFELASVAPVVGANVLFIGYSQDNLPSGNEDRGTKRWGANIIVGTNEDSRSTIITQYGNSANAVAVSPGDSGGPMFSECKVAGVASRMGPRPGGGKISLHTNLMGDNKQFLKDLEAKGAYYCGFSGNDPLKCPVAGASRPTNPTDSEEFPCNSGENPAPVPTPVPVPTDVGDIKLAMVPDSQANSPLFISFKEKIDEVFVCRKDSITECNATEFPVSFVKQQGDRFIYATTTMLGFSASLKFVVTGKVQTKPVAARLVIVEKK